MRWDLPPGSMPAMAACQAARRRAQPSAIETLRHRYALGEIDTATFEQMVERVLTSERANNAASSPSPRRIR